MTHKVLGYVCGKKKKLLPLMKNFYFVLFIVYFSELYRKFRSSLMKYVWFF